MVQSFKEWVAAHKGGKKYAKALNRECATPLPGLSAIEEDIDDLLSELGSVPSAGASTLGRMIKRNPPTVADARLQRLEVEVIKISDEVRRLASLLTSIIDTLQGQVN